MATHIHMKGFYGLEANESWRTLKYISKYTSQRLKNKCHITMQRKDILTFVKHIFISFFFLNRFYCKYCFCTISGTSWTLSKYFIASVLQVSHSSSAHIADTHKPIPWQLNKTEICSSGCAMGIGICATFWLAVG